MKELGRKVGQSWKNYRKETLKEGYNEDIRTVYCDETLWIFLDAADQYYLKADVGKSAKALVL
jgi:hypothetical protein